MRLPVVNINMERMPVEGQNKHLLIVSSQLHIVSLPVEPPQQPRIIVVAQQKHFIVLP